MTSTTFGYWRRISRISAMLAGWPSRSALGTCSVTQAVPLVEHFELVVGKEIEDARLKVLVAAGRIVADQGVVHLHAQHARLVQFLRHALGRPLRPHHGQPIPAPPHAFGLEAGVLALDVEIQG